MRSRDDPAVTLCSMSEAPTVNTLHSRQLLLCLYHRAIISHCSRSQLHACIGASVDNNRSTVSARTVAT